MAKYASLVAAYSLPAALVWAAVGFLLNVIPLNRAALLIIVVYCLFYGFPEALGMIGPRPVGSSWQVPQHLVADVSRRRRILTWGAILGPGFATRNPYAGFGLLPLVLAALGHVGLGVATAAAVGIAHGTGRALAVIRDSRSIDAAEYLNVVLKSMYWRKVDGLVLLVVGSIATTSAISTFLHLRV